MVDPLTCYSASVFSFGLSILAFIISCLMSLNCLKYCNIMWIFCFRFGLTVVYLFAIQYFNKIGGKISVNLIKYENNESTEYSADSLIYKVTRRNSCNPLWIWVSTGTPKYLLSLAGVWSLLYAIIYWNFLPCTSSPQFFDSSPSFDSASNRVWGSKIC